MMGDCGTYPSPNDYSEVAEEWRAIPDWTGYEVSSLGRVRSVERQIMQWYRSGYRPRKVSERILKQAKSSGGKYWSVVLSSPGNKQESKNVHRLVAEAFFGPAPSTKHQVAHNDGDGLNNKTCNLRWATPSENAWDKKRHGTLLTGENHPQSRISDETVYAIRQAIKGGLSVRRAAKTFAVSRGYAWEIGIGRYRVQPSTTEQPQ